MKNRVSDLQVKFVQILREENENANRLAKAALVEYMLILSQVLSFVQISPLIDSISVQEIGPRDYWTIPIISYLKDGKEVEGLSGTFHSEVPHPRGGRLCHVSSP